MKNDKDIKLIIEKDNEKEFKSFLSTNHSWDKLRLKDELIVHYAVSCFALKVLKLMYRSKGEIRAFKSRYTEENLIHVCLASEFSGSNAGSGPGSGGSTSNYFSSNYETIGKDNNGSQSLRNRSDKEVGRKRKCEMVSYLISEMKVICCQDNEKNTEFHKLLFHPCKVCFTLLSASVDSAYKQLVNAQNNSPFELSIHNGNYEAYCLLKKSFNKQQRNRKSSSLLHLASIGGSMKILKDLIDFFYHPEECKIVIDQCNENGQSCFTLACRYENYEIARFLLDKEVRVSVKDLNILKSSKNIELYKIVLALIKNKSVSSNNILRAKSQTHSDAKSKSNNNSSKSMSNQDNSTVYSISVIKPQEVVDKPYMDCLVLSKEKSILKTSITKKDDKDKAAASNYNSNIAEGKNSNNSNSNYIDVIPKPYCNSNNSSIEKRKKVVINFNNSSFNGNISSLNTPIISKLIPGSGVAASSSNPGNANANTNSNTNTNTNTNAYDSSATYKKRRIRMKSMHIMPSNSSLHLENLDKAEESLSLTHKFEKFDKIPETQNINHQLNKIKIPTPEPLKKTKSKIEQIDLKFFDNIESEDIKPKSSNYFFKPTNTQKSYFFNNMLNSSSNSVVKSVSNTPNLSSKLLQHSVVRNQDLSKYLVESKKTLNTLNTNNNEVLSLEEDTFISKKFSSKLSFGETSLNHYDFNLIKSFLLLDYHDIVKHEKIYSIENTEIFRGEYLGIEVGIKEYLINHFEEIDKKHFITEMSLLINLRHPLIVTFIGYCQVESKFLIVTEYMKNKSLMHYLGNLSLPLTEPMKVRFCLDIAKTIWYLHSRNPPVYHRDLKSSNCLVTDDLRIKLCDFGIGKIFEGKHQTETKSNTYWMAPESILHSTYTDKSDIYSMSILFWEIFHRDTSPYKNCLETVFFFEEKLRENRPVLSESLSNAVKKLLVKCWDFDPDKRPSIKEVVSELEEINRCN